jgi:DinB family protein
MAKTQKEMFLARLMLERDKFELLLNRVGYTRRMTVKGVSGKWSIKDILAHILAYEQYIADRMNEILHGETYIPCRTQNALDAFLDEFGYPDFGSPLLDDDGPNAWVAEKYQRVSLEDVVAQELQAFAAIISSFEKMPEDLLNRHGFYERVANNTYRHYREHILDIKRWLRANKYYI